ncbi:protein transport membrane glycoprotein-like protein Sec20 [Calycina marina]|uniref:Protein transport membrane glycoprotein-like protein Sec20 n=1 Tax=Calycina marina TaxID=1763456 RepID=A0A9P8CCN1_9HELO|nr:protein transport membrane glycoprotein-like protein Sec20 [Calycina marina]
MSFAKISERLLMLQENNEQLRTLIDRLATITFQPGSIPLDDDEDNVKTELISEITQTVIESKAEVEELQDRAERLKRLVGGDEETDREREEVQRGVQRAVAELRELEIGSRKAQIEAKRNLQRARRQERNILLQNLQQVTSARNSGVSSPSAGVRSHTPQLVQMHSREDKVLNATNAVTQELRRAHEMMSQELSKSQYAQETLDASTYALEQLGETYSSLDTMLSASKNLLGTLLRSQKSDTWYLESSMYVLSITIGWLVFRRFIYGPAWWLLWMPTKAVLFLFYQAWVGVFAAVGLVSSSSADIRENVAVAVGGGDSMIVAGSARATVTGTDAPVMGVSDTRRTDTHQEDNTFFKSVGRIVDGGQTDEAAKVEGDEAAQVEGDESTMTEETPKQEEAETQRNPKKRMWEEKEAQKEEQRKKDEL